MNLKRKKNSMYTVEEFDKEKTKVMQFIMYKKRTEYEVRNKFQNIIQQDMLTDIIEYVKEAGYLNDADYIKKSVKEFILLKNLSIKELKYKLYSKGISNEDLEEYISENLEELQEYEIKSAMNIKNKKKDLEQAELKQYLLKKGYNEETIKEVI